MENGRTIILTPGMVLAQMAGLPYNPVLEEAPGPKFFAVTNVKRYKGAASILNLDLIKEKVGKRFIVLPSSIHEMFLVPVAENEEVDLESYTQTVREANETFEPEIILSDSVFTGTVKAKNPSPEVKPLDWLLKEETIWMYTRL